ncbi:MAG TPA: DUF6781 family protein [Burkholderiaceae bacterium]
MIKAGIDQDALIQMFSEATAKQGDALRKAVREATLKALQGRELTLDNIKKVLKSVTDAATAGAAKNVAPAVDVEALLGKALAGMDGALLQAVEANHKALQQFVSQGAALQEKPLKDALDNIEKMEDVFFKTVGKAAQGAGGALQGPWEQALQAMKIKGSETGAQASQTVEQLLSQAQTVLRDGRTAGLRTAQALLDGYAAMVSGVLIGMSEGLRSGGSAADAAPAAKARRR